MSTKQLVERLYNKPIEEILKYFYLEKDMSMEEVSKELTVSVGSIVNWLNKYGITKHQNKLFTTKNDKWRGEMKT
jgi:predicted DNA-binding protein YlxM (UPF0122 family)